MILTNNEVLLFLINMAIERCRLQYKIYDLYVIFWYDLHLDNINYVIKILSSSTDDKFCISKV